MPKAPLDHLEAETKTPEPAVVEWEGKSIVVLPLRKWKASGLRALREADFDLWAEKCLDPKSYREWQDIDPDFDQCEDFFTRWGEVTGESRPN